MKIKFLFFLFFFFLDSARGASDPRAQDRQTNLKVPAILFEKPETFSSPLLQEYVKSFGPLGSQNAKIKAEKSIIDSIFNRVKPEVYADRLRELNWVVERYPIETLALQEEILIRWGQNLEIAEHLIELNRLARHKENWIGILQTFHIFTRANFAYQLDKRGPQTNLLGANLTRNRIMQFARYGYKVGEFFKSVFRYVSPVASVITLGGTVYLINKRAKNNQELIAILLPHPSRFIKALGFDADAEEREIGSSVENIKDIGILAAQFLAYRYEFQNIGARLLGRAAPRALLSESVLGEMSASALARSQIYGAAAVTMIEFWVERSKDFRLLENRQSLVKDFKILISNHVQNLKTGIQRDTVDADRLGALRRLAQQVKLLQSEKAFGPQSQKIILSARNNPAIGLFLTLFNFRNLPIESADLQTVKPYALKAGVSSDYYDRYAPFFFSEWEEFKTAQENLDDRFVKWGRQTVFFKDFKSAAGINDTWIDFANDPDLLKLCIFIYLKARTFLSDSVTRTVLIDIELMLNDLYKVISEEAEEK